MVRFLPVRCVRRGNSVMRWWCAAKCEIAVAALAMVSCPAHNVTTEIRDSNVVREDARRAGSELGFLRMWSIHPNQILPIVEAMRPDLAEVNEAAGLLLAAKTLTGGRSNGKANCMTALPIVIIGSCCNGLTRQG